MKQLEGIDERCGLPCKTMGESSERELRELSTTALLAEAEAVGIWLTLVGQCLHIRGPRSAEALGPLAVAGTQGGGAGPSGLSMPADSPDSASRRRASGLRRLILRRSNGVGE